MLEPIEAGLSIPSVLAKIDVLSDLSIVIPTFHEVENIPIILDRINRLKEAYDLTLEVLFMDDGSNDGSVEAVIASGYSWAKLIERTGPRGLSAAVIDGFERARYTVLICMDCDLSHPVEVIPQMVLALATGQQFAVGSRYVSGGSTDDDWGIFRYLNSRVATLLARPLTKVSDPMSGFFAMRREDFLNSDDLNPVGYKIALEIIVKCHFNNVAEIPIHFSDRIHGESKLTLTEQLKYLKHVRRLYLHSFSNAMHLLQFLVVGASGVVVNLSVLSLLLLLNLPDTICLAGGIAVSVVTNFLLNRRFTFSYARDRSIGKQFLGFISVSSFGIVVNYLVAMSASKSGLADLTYGLHLSALAGISCGMFFNYIGNRYVVFRKTRIHSDRAK
ncbi:glycosyltransferase family 2 protein [Sulfitobacter sp.]|uniref:glycosyltransferase family 2 protein n=1 Tax=Sulfitobacter sp. TaxID=1903071 RepID=UPI00300299BB